MKGKILNGIYSKLPCTEEEDDGVDDGVDGDDDSEGLPIVACHAAVLGATDPRRCCC